MIYIRRRRASEQAVVLLQFAMKTFGNIKRVKKGKRRIEST
jgi:hypothetical protein